MKWKNKKKKQDKQLYEIHVIFVCVQLNMYVLIVYNFILNRVPFPNIQNKKFKTNYI